MLEDIRARDNDCPMIITITDVLVREAALHEDVPAMTWEQRQAVNGCIVKKIKKNNHTRNILLGVGGGVLACLFCMCCASGGVEKRG
jgi:hypothetical protein